MSELTRNEYNKIARQYADAKGRVSAQHSIYPTFRKVVGDISGLRALDLACGEGYTSRILAEQGARKVYGVDISEAQIEIAREKEAELKQGIDYIVADASKPEIRKIGKFDLVTGAFLLNYSDTRKMLYDMVGNIKALTKPNGRVVGLVPNSDAGLNAQGLSVKLSPLKGQEEGSPYKVEFFDQDGNVFCEFTNYFWLRKTYEKAFTDLGFKFKWHNPVVSEQGLREIKKEVWDEYLKNPTWMAFEARK